MKHVFLWVTFLFTLVFVGATFAVAPISWTVKSLESVSCNSVGINFITTLSGYTGGSERFRTTVDAGGNRYMDEDAGTPGSGNGDYPWSLYDSSSGGPTTASFPLPPNTPIVIYFMLIDGPGGSALTDVEYDLPKCGSEPPAPVCASIPEGAVVGEFTSDAILDWAPGKSTEPNAVVTAGNKAWVLGTDETGQYYQIWWSCQHLWVPVGTMAPAFGDPVWQGMPLPTNNVS